MPVAAEWDRRRVFLVLVAFAAGILWVGENRWLTEQDSLDHLVDVQAVLAARIDRLSEREKAVLQAASVIGASFPEDQLREITDRTEADLRDAHRPHLDGTACDRSIDALRQRIVR